MCDDRERLIEYLYGESARDERRRVEDHLEECPACRSEVAGLRAVRDDLLAWKVPEPEPVWRPVVPAPVVVQRRSLPAWALAAAASVLFAVGLTGGMVVRGGMLGDVPATAAVAPVPSTGPATAAVTPADLARLEAALVARMTAEIDRKVEAVSLGASTPTTSQVSAPVANEDLARRVAILEGWKDDQISLNALFNGNFGRLNNRTASLSQELEMSMLRQVGWESAPR